MQEKIVVKDLYKIFGPKPDVAMQMLRSGKDKDDIVRQTGMVVGVQNASFHINAGEIFVIMGLSGSGKSTLIRLLNRLIEPSSGQVLVDGQDVASMDPKQLIELRRRDMAMVFQSFALLPHLTVLANAAFGLEVSGVPRKEREARAMKVLEQVGLAAFANRYPRELSGGMQQRAGLARALVVNPSLMLMDEAFSALDPLKRTEMQGLLLDLQRDHKRTIIFVSHDLDEACRIGDRIAIMEGGRIVQIGTPDDIIRNPVDDYVRAFFNGVDVNKYLSAKDVADVDAVPVFFAQSDFRDGFHAVIERLRAARRNYGFVLDSDRKLVGTVSIDSMIRSLESGSRELSYALLGDLPPVNGDLNLSDLICRIVKMPYPLPVVEPQGHYIGAVTQTILLKKMAKEELTHA
ncbi:glycine betaine/L-proline ABC transporter ATP-binding protein ProV [Aromatoleum toluvorans]|uniref:Quaternary amine transport ATP-binding protein n=2 Tax=Aromatoleum toluvorans TaxID=92002 RepID=A0ABX1Q6F0_9RHOO|nr:glycine betaine/L-proline ABC transporter ATP-binding protein ProV [Aromatoleum toluvorans]NMG46070.1 glycine betaine/L-proline ABC transporter ATP-binding protein ProV [Aromatoleum toluvorans]